MRVFNMEFLRIARRAEWECWAVLQCPPTCCKPEAVHRIALSSRFATARHRFFEADEVVGKSVDPVRAKTIPD
jgi:hypothetical protein